MTTEQTHPNPPTISPVVTPTQPGTSTFVFGQGKTAPRPFLKLLTTKYIYDLAPDPSLVPRPLTIRKQTRNVSAPAALGSATLDTWQAERCNETRDGGKYPTHHFRDRPRSHQHAILDIISRIVANGVDAAQIAKDMDMDPNELIQYMASFGVSARDAPSVLDEEIHAFFSSVPTTVFSGDKLCSALSDRDETPKPTHLMDIATNNLEAESDDGTESTHSQIAGQGLLSWSGDQDDVFGDSPHETVVAQVGGTHVQSEDVYHDAQESYGGTLSQESGMKLLNSDNPTCSEDLAGPEGQLDSKISFMAVPTPNIATGRKITEPRVFMPPVSILGRLFWKIPRVVWIILAVMAGRLLGILLTELDGSVP
ncbi:uncharacterized protein Z520_09395 [Fonsecaea multimorphosa CBS 102226]|uniref:Uncharacterized protein n=1 Tax=Fonsecaea multimorphosa CBS 102226 TaxID=1442371 RepID=A0A0D2GYS7_9EURO|nr:uncharacterized protein Z520_09395 [Fonsecaea multimorphosa CBS 102226]KIX94705.1 hypothetical protein Z520_09395 [Fonsecaea multimorphosa CBS 102226]OAL20480.1 hypothetical protein AYO22_08781 [Fonsecaea multimorphosa]